MIRFLMLLLVFWAMQAAAAILFKYGSSGGGAGSRRWLTGFLSGNTIGMTSMWLCMLIYAAVPDNANLAAALAGGGTFVVSQLALAGVFRSKLSWRQWGGIGLAALGLLLAGWHSAIAL